jgi:[ribosomal protein S5]-alanine N-acetyltransferase
MISDQARPGAFGPIETQRLTLRRYARGEEALVHRVMSDPQVMRYYPEPLDLERSREVLEKILAAYDKPGYSLLAVERNSDGRYIGQIGLLHWDDVDSREDVEVAYMLLAEHWGFGYATEAARACRDWAFAHVANDRVVSFIDVNNAPSIAVAQRNGMLCSKRIEQSRFGKPIYVYAIERERWREVTARPEPDNPEAGA